MITAAIAIALTESFWLDFLSELFLLLPLHSLFCLSHSVYWDEYTSDGKGFKLAPRITSMQGFLLHYEVVISICCLYRLLDTTRFDSCEDISF